MRRLLTIAVLVVAALAVAVPSASGARYDPNPDFPHDDFDAGNWEQVLLANESQTSLVSPTFHNVNWWNLYHDSGLSYGWLSDLPGWNCADEGDISGEFIDGGTDLYVYEADMLTPFCFTGTDLPWYATSPICQHGPSGDIWLRLNMSVEKNAYTIAGEVFLKVDLATGSMSSNMGLFNHEGSADSRLDAEFEFEGLPENATTMSWGPCGWPEFQS